MISIDVAAQMRAAVAALQADATGAEASQPGIIDRLWSDAIGASSSVAAAASLADAAQREADTAAEQMAELLAQPGATDADGIAAIRQWQSGGSAAAQVQAVADQLSPATAVSQTAAGTVADLRSLAPKVGLGLLVAVGLALGVYLGVMRPRP